MTDILRRSLAAALALCLACLPTTQAWAQFRQGAPTASARQAPGVAALPKIGTSGAATLSHLAPPAFGLQPLPTALPGLSPQAALSPAAAAGLPLAAPAAAGPAAPAAEKSEPSEKPALAALQSAAQAAADMQGDAAAAPEDAQGSPVFDGAADKKHLVFDFHQADFRAGYAAATAWSRGDAIVSGKKGAGFLQGMAYRVAELRQSEAAGKEFILKAEGLDDAALSRLADSYLGGAASAPSLRENLADADYSQGYLTGAGWRPEKQLWMPAPGLLQRFNPALRGQMTRRDERFMQGLRDSLRERHGEKAVETLDAGLTEGPKTGTREFATKLQHVLRETLSPLFDDGLAQRLPFIAGKVRIPRSLVWLTVGHSILIIFGINLHMNAQPYLVYGLTGSKAMMGVIRNVHFGAYSVASFLPVGPVIDKTDYSTIYTWTSLMRALLMGLIPLIYLTGGLSFAVLALIVAINPLFQTLMTNADSAGRASMLGRDETIVRAGTAFSIKIGAVAGLAIPFLAAYVVGLLAQAFGEPGGYAIAYAGYALSLLVAAPIFKFLVRDPRHHDPEIAQKPSRNPLNIFHTSMVVLTAPLKLARWAWGKVFGRTASAQSPAAAVAPQEEGTPGIRERLARFFDRWEALQGIAVILRSDTLMIMMAITAVELFLADALTFVVLPNYIIDVIHPQASLASIPFIGTMLSTKAGIMGLMLTFASLGSYLSTQWLSGAKGELRIKRLGSGFFYRLAAVGSLFFWTMMIPTFFIAPGAALSLPLFFGSLGIFLGMEFLTRLFHTPLMTVMSPVTRNQIPNDKVGKVYAAFTMLNVGLMAIGALALGFIVDAVPIATAVFLVSIGVSVTALLQWLSPKWLGKINPAGWEKGEKKAARP